MVENREIFIPHLYLAPPPGPNFVKMFDASKPGMIGLMVKNIAEKFNRLSRVHERHRQTTDTIAVPLAEHNVVTFS